MEFDSVSRAVIGSAVAVHRELGPGLLESTYEHCLAYELASRGIGFKRQAEEPVRYRGTLIECGYRLDLLVENSVVVELKSVDAMLPIHVAQLVTYLRLSELKVGLLLNFNVQVLKKGIKRIVL